MLLLLLLLLFYIYLLSYEDTYHCRKQMQQIRIQICHKAVYISYCTKWVIVSWLPGPRRLFLQASSGPVSWGYWILWVHLCTGVRLPKWVSRLWHLTIWWCGPSDAGALVNGKYPFTAITPRSTPSQSASTW